MDSSDTHKSSLSIATKPTRMNTCCTILVNCIMLIFFGIYSFNNPEYEPSLGKGCYVYRDAEG